MGVDLVGSWDDLYYLIFLTFKFYLFLYIQDKQESKSSNDNPAPSYFEQSPVVEDIEEVVECMIWGWTVKGKLLGKDFIEKVKFIL